MPVIIVSVIFLDQLTKYWIANHMDLGMSLPVWPDVFHITYILNAGAAFGILENQRWFFIAIAVALILALIYYYPKLKDEHWLMRLGIALLVGGAAGNLVDRIQTGQVVDFFDFRVWPIFNVADIAICCGVTMILFVLFYWPKKEEENG